MPLKTRDIINPPNLVTLLAFAFAWAGLLLLFNNRFFFSFSMILLATILDYLDGFLARKFKIESQFGRLFDSQIDVFVYLIYTALAFYFYFGLNDLLSSIILFFFLMCGIFRLVRFDVLGFVGPQDSSRKYYPGLPVPFGHFIIPFLIVFKFLEIKYFDWIAYLLILTVSVLMVQNFPFPKPKRIGFILFLYFLAALIMAGIGIYLKEYTATSWIV